MKKLLQLGARAVFVGFYLLSAIYCLLAYLPFTYNQVHAGGLLPWLDEFVRIQPWLNLMAVAVCVPLLVEPWKKGGLARWLAAGLGAFELATAVTLVVHPVLPRLANDSMSLVWSLVNLAPLAWLAGVDAAAYAGQVQWTEKPERRGASYFAACCGGLFVSLLYAAVWFVRRPAGPALQEDAATWGWSLLLHLLLFLGMYLVMECVAAAAGLFTEPAKLEFWLCHLLLAGAIGYVLRLVAWPALGFDGAIQMFYSAVVGAILAALNAGVALWLAAGQPAPDGIATAAAPLTLGLMRSWRSAAAVLVALGLIGGFVAEESALMDWNGLLQRLTAAGIWLGSFACFYTIGATRLRLPRLSWLMITPLVFLGAYKGLQAAPIANGPALERWSGLNASLRLAQQFLTPPRREQESFFQFLTRSTNISASVHVDPVSVDFTPELSHSQGPVPNIFIFTIDSLRRDYLSPYNPAVEFTPAIAAFARESTMFENAFTRYGGTGLSEPAIWSGSMLLHKQYVTPFAPMNALEKLIKAEQYQAFLSRDSILSTILQRSAADVELDAAGTTMTLDFARTLEQLEKQIDRRGTNAQPIFAYTQPQNLHISVIQREGASAPKDEAYPGFYPPYASRVKRIDAAFGNFVEYLKARGLYDHSIIVLTADHGDSLGEGGRWGHAYTIYPEIVRVPLLIRVPDELRAKYAAEPKALAFSTDITPSLYYLLGHRPTQKNELFGAPLFTETPAERQRDPRANYLLASSYAAVYGILSDGGRRLYVADGVNYQNYLFEINGLSAESQTLTGRIERDQDELIRAGIESINRFYRFGGGQP